MSNVNKYRKSLSKEDYLNKYIIWVDKNFNLAKQDYMISKGLYLLVECDEKTEGATYDYKEKKYYCKSPIDIDDETFFEFKSKLSVIDISKIRKETNTESTVSVQWPSVLGLIILVVGLFLGLLVPIVGTIYLASSVVLMTILFALGSILRIVKEIHLTRIGLIH